MRFRHEPYPVVFSDCGEHVLLDIAGVDSGQFQVGGAIYAYSELPMKMMLSASSGAFAAAWPTVTEP